METNLLLNWKFWLTFYFFLSYSWCLLDIIELIIKIPLTRIFNPYGTWFDKKLGRRKHFILVSSIDTITHLFCITAFVGGVQVMLTSTGIKIFTFGHIICFLLAFLFSAIFHRLLVKDLHDLEPKFFKILIPGLILSSFIFIYILSITSSSLLSKYIYLGSFVHKYFLISWFPWTIILTAVFTGGTKICIKILSVLPKSFLKKLNYNHRNTSQTQNSETLAPEVLVARKCLNDSQTYEVAKYPTYPIREADVNLARKNPDTFFAKGLIENPNYQISGMDVKTGLQNPTSKLAVVLNKKINQELPNFKSNFDTRILFSGKLLENDFCICAFCRKTKKVGAKMAAGSHEVDQRTLVICLDCHLEQIALFHNISKEEALKLHNFVSNKVVKPFTEEFKKGYLKVMRKSSFDSKEEEEKVMGQGMHTLYSFLRDKRLYNAFDKLSKDELVEKFHALFSDPRVFNLPSATKVARIKIGRNSPCPCGSGRKYKKCCLNQVA